MSYQQHILNLNVKPIRSKRLKELLRGFGGYATIIPDVYQTVVSITESLGAMNSCCILFRNSMDHISNKTVSYYHYNVVNTKN